MKSNCYKALVKPVLDYGSCVWDPHHQKKIREIEKVQKNAAQFVTNNYSYTQGSTKANMTQLGWIPLEEQRARLKVTILYQAINGLVTIPMEHLRTNKQP